MAYDTPLKKSVLRRFSLVTRAGIWAWICDSGKLKPANHLYGVPGRMKWSNLDLKSKVEKVTKKEIFCTPEGMQMRSKLIKNLRIYRSGALLFNEWGHSPR